jgi:hypothetical protein
VYNYEDWHPAALTAQCSLPCSFKGQITTKAMLSFKYNMFRPDRAIIRYSVYDELHEFLYCIVVLRI